MEDHINPLAITHLLQHTLRSLCIHENSQWVYAVFWRILPRNYPPPKWDGQGGAYGRSRGNRRNWILVWEDGFCNFAASTTTGELNSDCPSSSSSSVYGNEFQQQHFQAGLQPELFFKMSHEIYNYGECLIGKVAADHSHKWVHREPNDQEINFLSAWHDSADSHPRTWEAQFQSGIKTIALIAVREGVVQLGAINKVMEDLSYVVLLRKKFSYIESIPGVLLPHPSSSSFPAYNSNSNPEAAAAAWQFQGTLVGHHHPSDQFYENFSNNNNHQLPLKITPSMSSLEALLSKLPSVVPPPGSAHYYSQSQPFSSAQRPLELMESMENKLVMKEESEHGEEIIGHHHEKEVGGDHQGGGGGISMGNYHGFGQFSYH